MTTKPRRYVRVRMLSHYDALASWSCRLCTTVGGYWSAEDAHREAAKHARECEAIRIATERDHAYRLLSDIAWVLGGPDDIPEAVSLLRQAYRDERADNSRLRAERDQWRTKAHELAAELLLRDERKETPC